MPKSSSEKPKQKNLRALVLGISCALALGLFLLFLANKTEIEDYFKGLSYEPTEEMILIRDSLGLTDDGLRIFNAAHPVLDSRDDFNRDCDSSNPDIAVYGCYYSDKIFVYNIDSEELAGFRESTAAHELLHAVWDRLSGVEKSRLIPLLESGYAENKSVLEETLEAYDESEKIDELYVRLATQIKNLSPELEAHYSKIFSDQDKIVEFYDSYVTPFEELNKKIEELGKELETLKSDIDAKTLAYESRSEKFNADVAEFNNCANTAGCFSSDWAFSTRRYSLISEEENLNDLYNELNAMIDSYNSKVEIYNSNILHSNTLQSLINSNSSLENIE